MRVWHAPVPASQNPPAALPLPHSALLSCSEHVKLRSDPSSGRAAPNQTELHQRSAMRAAWLLVACLALGAVCAGAATTPAAPGSPATEHDHDHTEHAAPAAAPAVEEHAGEEGHDHADEHAHEEDAHGHGSSDDGHSHGVDAMALAELAAELGSVDAARDELCNTVANDGYNLGLHIGAVFILLAVSALGAVLPVVLHISSKSSFVLAVVKMGTFFGFGTILATAFIHMLLPAARNLSSPCLPASWNERYEAWAYLFVVLSIVFMQLIDYLIEGAYQRYLERRGGQPHTAACHEQAACADEHTHHAAVVGAIASMHTSQAHLAEAVQAAAQHKLQCCPHETPEEHEQHEHEHQHQHQHTHHSGEGQDLEAGHAHGHAHGLHRHSHRHSHGPSHGHSHGHGHGHEGSGKPGTEDLPSATGSGDMAEEGAPCEVHGGGCTSLIKHSSGGGSPARTDPSQVVGIYMMEAGIIFHSVLIGITLGVTGGSAFNTLLAALSFHQFFEGFAIGAAVVDSGLGAVKSMIMGLAYAVTTPTGIAIGIGMRESFNQNAETTLFVEGIFDSISTGILIYVVLVELINPLMTQSAWLRSRRWWVQALSFASFYGGVTVMAVIGKWA
ncbi:hypothetical protein ABPG75_008141 [Micractinium tetrahymenae]